MRVSSENVAARAEMCDLLTTGTELGSINWADEMEDAPMPSAPSGSYGGDRGYSTGGGFNGRSWAPCYDFCRALLIPVCQIVATPFENSCLCLRNHLSQCI